MSNSILEAKGLSKAFGGVRPLDAFSLTVRQGEIVGLVGPNGAGKTTFFNVVTGLVPPDAGAVAFGGLSLAGMAPHHIAALGIGRTFQSLRLISRLSVVDNVLLAFRRQLGESLSAVFLCPRACARREMENRQTAISLLASAGLDGRQDVPASDLSYGQQKLLSLVCCLASGASLFLLDEPVAGIAPQMVERVLGIISELPSRGASVIMIEHNMDAVAEVCSRTVFMHNGRTLAEGTTAEVRRNPVVIEAYLGR